jgi:hypothetical protein
MYKASHAGPEKPEPPLPPTTAAQAPQAGPKTGDSLEARLPRASRYQLPPE